MEARLTSKLLSVTKSLFASLPQLILQLSIFLSTFEFELKITRLEIYQLIKIAFSLVSLSYGTMEWVRMQSKHSIKVDIGYWSFKISRFLSNFFYLISRVLPLALLFGECIRLNLILVTIGAFVYIMIRLIIFLFYFRKIKKNQNQDSPNQEDQKEPGRIKKKRTRTKDEIINSVFFFFFKWAAFCEGFECNFILLPLLLLENVIIFRIYYLHSTRNKDVDYYLLGFGSLLPFIFGNLIEFFFWYCYKKSLTPIIKNGETYTIYEFNKAILSHELS